MPDHDDAIRRTYTNIVFANEMVLVPTSPDYCPELDEEALASYRRWLPERRMVGIDASGLIRMNGALRCITMNLPTRAYIDFLNLDLNDFCVTIRDNEYCFTLSLIVNKYL